MDTHGFEGVFGLVGGHHRFQGYCLALVSIQLLIMSWNHLGYIFMGSVPQHWCRIHELDGVDWSLEEIRNLSVPRKGSGGFESCEYFDINYTKIWNESGGNVGVAGGVMARMGIEDLPKRECEEWVYDKSVYEETIVSQFNLVCGRRVLVASIQAFYMIGALTGTILCGPLNDKLLGRRRTTLIAIVLVTLAGLVTSQATSYWIFVGSRFIVAMGTAGCMQATSVWLMEHCDTKCRSKLYCISVAFFGAGAAVMSGYAYLFRTWWHLQLAFTATTCLLLSFFWIFPESPRWLAVHGRTGEAIQSLQRIAFYNKFSLGSSKLVEYLDPCQSTTSVPSKSLLASFKQLLSTPKLRWTSFVMWSLFVCTAFTYYGFTFSGSVITSNPYLLVALGGLMEIPAAILPIPFLNRWGRRPTTLACYLGTALSAMGIVFTPASNEALRTFFYATGKTFIASAFTLIYLVVNEVYPTICRTTGQGTSAFMGRFGSISAPYVADMLTTVYPDLPSVVFGCVAVGASSLALLIPETNGVQMEDTLGPDK